VTCAFPRCPNDVREGDRFCPHHEERLGFLLAQLDVHCPRCGELIPYGLLLHDCPKRTPVG